MDKARVPIGMAEYLSHGKVDKRKWAHAFHERRRGMKETKNANCARHGTDIIRHVENF